MPEPKVRLRAFEKTDLDKAHKFYNDPELQHFLSINAVMPLSREEEAAFIESCINPKDKNTSYTFAIETMRGEFIGGCSYMRADMRNRTSFIGISIADKRYWGKGYGTAAMRELLKFLFLEKNLRKVLLEVYDFNKRGIACYEKLGFKQEGCLRQQFYRAGKYHDILVMALFSEDFNI